MLPLIGMADDPDWREGLEADTVVIAARVTVRENGTDSVQNVDVRFSTENAEAYLKAHKRERNARLLLALKCFKHGQALAQKHGDPTARPLKKGTTLRSVQLFKRKRSGMGKTAHFHVTTPFKLHAKQTKRRHSVKKLVEMGHCFVPGCDSFSECVVCSAF